MIGDISAFRRALLGHFDRARRALPWRSERTPYRVMVSEFMLQQTRVETVIPYYERWLRRFPGWEALADAGEDEVLREWTGLGYYRRARNLHRVARVVRERFGGELPKEPAALKRLPGVGEYTAGAVASIAFGRAVPAVDGNVRRVLCRILDVAAPAAGWLRQEAARLVDPGRPGDFNEALMELGATVCTPRAPGCGGCPVRGWCGARGAGTVDERPARRRRREVARVEYGVVVVVSGGPSSTVTLLRKRPESGLLAGMWEFPSIELSGDEKPGRARISAAANRLLKDLGVLAHPTTPLPPIRHAFTHVHATYHPIICVPHPPTPRNPPTTSRLPHPTPPNPPTTPRVTHPTTPGPHPTPLPIPPPNTSRSTDPPHAGRNGADVPPIPTWIPLAHLNDYPLPVAQQKIAAQLRAWLRDNPRRASG